MIYNIAKENQSPADSYFTPRMSLAISMVSLDLLSFDPLTISSKEAQICIQKKNSTTLFCIPPHVKSYLSSIIALLTVWNILQPQGVPPFQTEMIHHKMI